MSFGDFGLYLGDFRGGEFASLVGVVACKRTLDLALSTRTHKRMKTPHEVSRALTTQVNVEYRPPAHHTGALFLDFVISYVPQCCYTCDYICVGHSEGDSDAIWGGRRTRRERA